MEWEPPTVQHTIPTPLVDQLQYLLLRPDNPYSQTARQNAVFIHHGARRLRPADNQRSLSSGINTRGANMPQSVTAPLLHQRQAATSEQQ
jgi:hypothetical protein